MLPWFCGRLKFLCSVFTFVSSAACALCPTSASLELEVLRRRAKLRWTSSICSANVGRAGRFRVDEVRGGFAPASSQFRLVMLRPIGEDGEGGGADMPKPQLELSEDAYCEF